MDGNDGKDDLEKINQLSPIEKETLHLLMQNLVVNLSSQNFMEQHLHTMENYRVFASEEDNQ